MGGTRARRNDPSRAQLADTGVAVVRGIPGEIREALLNLVQNALDAMVGGGTLGLRTYVTNGEARLEVRDSGIGMSAEVRERAFEPFFTTKGKAGTGLGLAEVYGIVKRHRGHAEIESTPGVGATVRLVFPRSSPQPASEPVIERPRVQVPRRVLLVEDHPDSREFMQALLESDGHTVDTAGGNSGRDDAPGDGEPDVRGARHRHRVGGRKWMGPDFVCARALACPCASESSPVGNLAPAPARTGTSFFGSP